MSQLPDPAVSPSADDDADPVVPPSSGHPGPATTIRLVVGIVLGGAIAALGGLILGEYPFTGLMPYIAGVLFGLVVTEVILSVGHRPGVITAVAGAACSIAGLGTGVWISVGEGIAPIPVGGWVAIIIGGVVALLRGGITTAIGPTRSNPPPS